MKKPNLTKQLILRDLKNDYIIERVSDINIISISTDRQQAKIVLMDGTNWFGEMMQEGEDFYISWNPNTPSDNNGKGLTQWN